MLVDFEEKEGALHVKVVQQNQVKAEKSTTEQLPVAVQTNLEDLTETHWQSTVTCFLRTNVTLVIYDSCHTQHPYRRCSSH